MPSGHKVSLDDVKISKKDDKWVVTFSFDNSRGNKPYNTGHEIELKDGKFDATHFLLWVHIASINAQDRMLELNPKLDQAQNEYIYNQWSKNFSLHKKWLKENLEENNFAKARDNLE